MSWVLDGGAQILKETASNPSLSSSYCDVSSMQTSEVLSNASTNAIEAALEAEPTPNAEPEASQQADITSPKKITNSAADGRRLLALALVMCLIGIMFAPGPPSKPHEISMPNHTENIDLPEASNKTSDMATVKSVTDICESLSQELDQYSVIPAIETLNLMFVGRSGLGKTTLQADIFRMLDPTWKHEAMINITLYGNRAFEVCQRIARLDEEEQRAADRSDDIHAQELQEERVQEITTLNKARVAFKEAVDEYRLQTQEIDKLAQKIDSIENKQIGLRGLRKYEESRKLQPMLDELRGQLRKKIQPWAAKAAPEGTEPEQTLTVQSKSIQAMPLMRGSDQRLDVTLIDTPGYSDVIVGTEASFNAVLQEVEARYQRHSTQQFDARTKMERSGLVHACIVFLSPHRMMEDDLQMMEKLQPLCPLLPVIAKADTMTSDEAVRYKDQVRRILKNRNVTTAAIKPSAWLAIEKRHASEHGFKPNYQLPLAVMASTMADKQGNSRRSYPWGDALPNHPMHSELTALREVLMTEGQWRVLRDQAIDKADAESRRRTGAEWQQAERERVEREKQASQHEEVRCSCPARLERVELEKQLLIVETASYSNEAKDLHAKLDEERVAVRRANEETDRLVKEVADKRERLSKLEVELKRERDAARRADEEFQRRERDAQEELLLLRQQLEKEHAALLQAKEEVGRVKGKCWF